MKTSKWFAITLAAAVTVGGLYTVHARPAGPAAPGPFAGKLRERLKEKLALTDEQVSQIKEQVKSEKDALKSLMTRLHEARTALRAEIQNADATETSIREAAAKLAVVQADLAVERHKLHGKISPILTDEQREKLNRFHDGMDRFRERAIDRAQERLAE